MSRRSTALLALALGLAWAAPAQDREGRFQASGFGTLGLAWNSTSQAAFLRDVSQPTGTTRTLNGRPDSRLGLQGDADLGSLRATVQVLGKYRYDGTFRPELSWGFLAWSPLPELQARAGRLGLDLFLDADSRDVGYSYLLVRPPVESYGLIPLTRMNGIDLAGTLPLGAQTRLRLKAYWGAVREKMPIQGQAPLDLWQDRVGGLIGEVQGGSWRARLAYARMDARQDPPAPLGALPSQLDAFAAALHDPALAQAADSLRFTGKTFQWYSAGFSWEADALQGEVMVDRVESDWVVLPDHWDGFADLGWRVGAVVPYGLVARIATHRPGVPDLSALAAAPVPGAAALAAGVAAFTGVNTNSQTTVAAGVRWDFAPKADFKLQADRIHSHTPTTFWDSLQPGWNGNATVVSATLDFVF